MSNKAIPAHRAAVRSVSAADWTRSLKGTARGRAIRIDPRDEFKTANNWHLGCVQTGVAAETDVGFVADERDFERETNDWTVLERRFRAFVGLRHDEATIENGIDRLGISTPITSATLAKYNARMCRDACERDSMTIAWQKALYDPASTQSRVVHDVLTEGVMIKSSWE